MRILPLIAVLPLVMLALKSASASGKSPGVVGAYTHFRNADTPKEVQALVNEAADAGIQFLLPVAKTTGGSAYYNSDILPRAQQDFDPLKVLIEAAHARGLEVHPWVCVNADGGANPSPVLQAHPDWCMVNSEGERVGALDPSSPEVRRHIAGVIGELARKYEIDGVSLDYVRYATPGRFCYCDRCKTAFKEATGLDCTDAYKAPAYSQLWRQWRLWRQKQLLAEMEEIRQALGEARPGATLSSYVWGAQTYGARYDTCQDFKTWIKKGLLDWINPSGYVYDRKTFISRAKANLAAMPEGFPTLITIGVRTSHGSLPTAKDVEVQIRDALELGADGVVLFTLESTRPFLKKLSPLFHEIGANPSSPGRARRPCGE